MFMKKANKKAVHRDQVMQLQIQRDTVKKNIRRLRNEMQMLVEQAVSADDLDRRLLSMEYDEKKAALGTDLWLVFPPGVYDAWEVRRLYFCLQDETAPWIGDLRNWKYVNFQLVPSLFR